MINFRIFGIEITVHPWFWLTMAFIGGALSIKSPEDVLPVILFVIAGFISILVHELGHGLLIRKYKLPTEIHLIAFGGFATHPAGALTRTQSFLVSLAGPVLQILLGLIAWLVLEFGNLPDTRIRDFVGPLAFVSIFWAVINLIPVYPLDGGQMLAALLGPRKAHITFLVGVVFPLLIVGFLLVRGLILPIAIIFLAFFAYQNWERYQQARPQR